MSGSASTVPGYRVLAVAMLAAVYLSETVCMARIALRGPMTR